MNSKQAKLLIRSDEMSESTLVRLEDWEIAYLRLAMVNQVQETLNESMGQAREDTLESDCKAGGQLRHSGRGYGVRECGARSHGLKHSGDSQNREGLL